MKILFISALIITIILNVIGIYYIDILFFGFFIMIGIYSLLSSKLVKLYLILTQTLVLVIFSEIIRFILDAVFNYTTMTGSGEIVPFWVKITSGLMTLVISEIISLVFAGVGIFLLKRKN